MRTKIIYYTLLLLLVSTLSISCYKEEIKKTYNLGNEEKDWDQINTIKTVLFKTPEEKSTYHEGTFLTRRQFEDSIYKNKWRLVLKFLTDYPESAHYYDALKLYFNPFLEPRFLMRDLSESQKQLLSQETKLTANDKSHMYDQFRALPYDIDDRKFWLSKGDSLADAFLITHPNMDERASIEVAVLGRDLRRASVFYQYLYLDKKKEEKNYWLLFDTHYWMQMIERIENLILKYPHYDKWPDLVDQFVFLITSDHLSPNLKIPLWNRFLEFTDDDKFSQSYKSIDNLREKCIANLKALQQLEVFDWSEPLNIELVDLYGKKIKLSDLRGKLILLDFWSIRCGPCIKEMPHIRALYDKYRDKGFEVIGIVQEGLESKNKVLEIIKRQGANWFQHLDATANSKVSYHNLFGVQAMPTVWLLDKNGVVIDKNARGDRLEPLIQKYIVGDN